MIDTDGALSGWRVLMMVLEHEVHHRSQIDTYAGLEQWEVPQIFDRYREQVELLQEEQRALAPGQLTLGYAAPRVILGGPMSYPEDACSAVIEGLDAIGIQFFILPARQLWRSGNHPL